MMKKLVWSALVLAFGLLIASPESNAQAKPAAPAPSAASAPAAAPAQANAPAALQGRKKRVAVFDFDYATVQTSTAALFGTNVDVGKGISDLLVTDLVKDGTYSVIERKALDKILAEQNFSNSDRANPNSAAKIGKLLGVDTIIVGSITQFGNETKNTNIGGAGAGLGGFGLGGFGKKESKAIVVVNARMVDIDTGEILGVADGKGESARKSTSLLGGGGNWHGFGAGGANFGSSDFQQTILGEAVKLAVDQMSTGLVANNTKLQTRTINVSGLVAAVEGGQIILNVGGKAGLKVGDQLNVERVTREIKDPSTRQVIRRLSSAVGMVKITEVDDISAVAVAVSGAGFKVGDAVKTVTQ
jgi:curli biogenesis system outer membrane secretion channel CsgG